MHGTHTALSAPSPSAHPDFAAVLVSGDDATAFLHSQLSQAVTDMAVGDVRLAGYLGPKGRLLMVCWVWRRAESEYCLFLARDRVPAVVKRLRMFVLRSKVVITPSEATVIVASYEAAPTGAVVGGGWALGVSADAPVVPESLKAFAEAQFAQAWPWVNEATQDQFLAQEIDLDLAGGVSFTKGCYPGQEIVARVHYLGRVKQRLFKARATGAAAGMPLINEADSTVGMVMWAAGDAVLLSLQLAAAEGRVRLPDGIVLRDLARAHPDAA